MRSKPCIRKGFTLVEMLIAVVIVAIVGTTIATSIGNVAGQTFSMERRTLANWVAQNEMTRLRLDIISNPRSLAEGKNTTRTRMGRREWEIQTTVIATDAPLLRRVEVDVFEFVDGDRKGPYEHLVAFVGRH